MRVRVRFRYNGQTGQVEVFEVADLHDGPRAADHDDRHDAVTADVGRVVDPHPRVVEFVDGRLAADVEPRRNRAGQEDQATERERIRE